MNIARAEELWRDAYEKDQRSSTAATMRAEQAAWDVYADLCGAVSQCLQPGCRTTTTAWAYCPEHRD